MKRLNIIRSAALALGALLLAGGCVLAALSQKTTGADVNPNLSDPAHEGLRLVGEFTSSGDVTAYGIAVGVGEASADSASKLVPGGVYNGRKVISYEQDYLDDEEKGYVYLTLYDFEEEDYALPLTWRTYIRKTDGTVEYADATQTVTLAAAALKNYYTGESVTGIDTEAEFISDIVSSAAAQSGAALLRGGELVWLADFSITDGALLSGGSAVTLQSGDELFFAPGTDTSGLTAAGVTLYPARSSEAEALNAVIRSYQKEMKANGVTSAVYANYYTMPAAGNSMTGLITQYIPSFDRQYMQELEIQAGELVYTGEALEDLIIESAEAMVPLTRDSSVYEAMLLMAESYYAQGNQIQYDQLINRRNVNALANDATADEAIYLDCSGYANSVLHNCFKVGDGASQRISADIKTTQVMSNAAAYYTNASKPRYVSYYERSAEDADSWTGGVGETESLTGEQVLEQLMGELQPGDMLDYLHGESKDSLAGHILIYMGDGKFLHCTGYSIGSGATAETVQAYTSVNHDNTYASADSAANETQSGAICILEAEYLFDEETLQYSPSDMNHNRRYLLYDGHQIKSETSGSDYKVWKICIMRPAADETTFGSLSEEAQALLAYPGLTIEKTVAKSGVNVYDKTVSAGDVLTVTLTLKNTGSKTLYNIPVTDPDKDGSAVGTVSSLAAGATKTLTYTLTASASAAGTSVTSGRASAGGVHSNVVRYCVASADEALTDAMSGLSAKLQQAIETAMSNSTTWTSPLNAVKGLYKSATGVSVLGSYSNGIYTGYTAIASRSTSYTVLNSSTNYGFDLGLPIVGNLLGGLRLNRAEDPTHLGTAASVDLDFDLNYCRRVKADYLEAGDIIIVSTYNSEKSRLDVEAMYIYISSSCIYKLVSSGSGYGPELAFTTEDQVTGFLTSLIVTDGYMVLRPALG